MTSSEPMTVEQALSMSMFANKDDYFAARLAIKDEAIAKLQALRKHHRARHKSYKRRHADAEQTIATLAAQVEALRGDAVVVPRDVWDWLMGESGEFVCDPAHYFRGKPPTWWWRGELSRRVGHLADREGGHG